MHQYLETVRTEIEAASGPESYLASSLFYRIFKELKYEDDGDLKITDKDGFENLQHKVTNLFAENSEFDLHGEILSWQAAMLRHISKEVYLWWVDYKEEKFAANDIFKDGESCMALEASCEKLGSNPTENYAALLEIEHVLIKLCTGPHKTIQEVDRFWRFKLENNNESPFTKKRIENERKATTLNASIEAIQEVSHRLRTNAKQLAGAGHLLWMNAHMMLEAYTVVLNNFLAFEYEDNMELALNTWIENMFPARLADSSPNSLHQSRIHHEVIERLSQATQCLVQQNVKKEDSFANRDAVVIPFIKDVMEQVKQVSLQNISTVSSELQNEQALK